MYAIVRTGGKQYKVQPGDVLHVEKLEKSLGDEFDLTDILLVGGDSTHIGQPTVKDAKVTVVVTKQARDKKIIIFKKKRRQGYRRTQGHRQSFTEIFVKSITSPDGKVAKTDAEPKVVDVAQAREDKILAKIAARKEALKAGPKTTAQDIVKSASAKKTKKKVTKKVAKKVGSKKSSKANAKKKVTKKTSKKA
jgi:large subunit ribosomal protein L21